MYCSHDILSRDREMLTIGYFLVLIADAWFDSLFQQCKDSIQHNCYLQSRIDGIQTSSSRSKKVVLFLWNIMFSWLEELKKRGNHQIETEKQQIRYLSVSVPYLNISCIGPTCEFSGKQIPIWPIWIIIKHFPLPVT